MLPFESLRTVRVKCIMCNHVYIFDVDRAGYEAWRSGTLIQDALPNLDIEKRELLISHTCSACFDSLCGKDG